MSSSSSSKMMLSSSQHSSLPLCPSPSNSSVVGPISSVSSTHGGVASFLGGGGETAGVCGGNGGGTLFGAPTAMMLILPPTGSPSELDGNGSMRSTPATPVTLLNNHSVPSDSGTVTPVSPDCLDYPMDKNWKYQSFQVL